MNSSPISDGPESVSPSEQLTSNTKSMFITRLAKRLAGKGWVLMLVPLLWACVSYVQGASPAPVPQGPKRPALVFNQYLVDLGLVPPTRFVHAYYRFTNLGSEPVEIRELYPSCGCLKPKIDKRRYAPGESGEFFLRIETANEEPGPHEYFLDIAYVDPQPRTVRVTYKVNLPKRQVLVEPPGLLFYQLSPVDSTKDVLITNFRNQPIEVTEVRSTTPYATAEVMPSERDVEGNQIIKVQVTASGQVPPGRTQGMIVLTTDDESYPEIVVHLRIEGPNSNIQPVEHQAIDKKQKPR